MIRNLISVEMVSEEGNFKVIQQKNAYQLLSLMPIYGVIWCLGLWSLRAPYVRVL